MAGRPVRVVIVDDSALARQLIRAMLGGDGSIEVVGSATDPTTAADIIRTKNPDVITLDVEMPNMDGLTFLEKIMRVKPTPVVMVSSLTERGADVTLQALELGAVDFVTKPRIDVARGFEEKRDELIGKIKAAARARVRALAVVTAPAAKERPKMPLVYRTTERIVAIGASTGGVEALREVICALPSDSPATLVVQHMPGGFTQRFAQRLNALAPVAVVEAQEGQRALPGHVYIAPGERHLRLIRSGAQYLCKIDDGDPVCGHRPSVDALFHSVAAEAGRNAIGVILTGMGADGAKGLKAMREAGARTIGQNEASCVVYGMPKAANALGATEVEAPIGRIAGMILERCAG
ncbi:MAG TPA: chemotaxis response regulator protein-glutamate methylesterase [Candidatus Angelobacter sp.]|nr:chemotaxis response regulator protein-glutamate methylesterase [Candidatus Angelobacter sp.]